jgi:hypothetical protein
MTTPPARPEVPAGLLAEYDQRYARAITALRAEATAIATEYGQTTEACVTLTRAIITGAGPTDEITIYGLATVIAKLLLAEIETALRQDAP